jgi:polysaccharide pyruvyl transferase WcaK-like protein
MCAPYKTIALLDHMGLGNLGDAAILEAFVQNIRTRIPTATLIAFSANVNDTRERHGLDCYPIRQRYASRLSRYMPARLAHFIAELVHLVQAYKTVKRLDLLVIAGGGQLCDLWYDQPYNIFKFCFLAKLAKVPVHIIGVGADRLHSRRGRIFARWAISLADYVCFRDTQSEALIRTLGCREQIHVCPDPAYAFRSSKEDLLVSHTNMLTTIGVNPMGFCDSRMWPRADASVYNCYLDKLLTFIQSVLDQGYDIELFSSDAGVDIYAIEDIVNRVRAELPDETQRRVTHHIVTTLDQLFAQMSMCSVIVTPKFHGVVFSQMLQKPVIALSYMPKINYLMERTGFAEYCLDIEHFTVEELEKAFHKSVLEQPTLEARCREVREAFRRELVSEFDRLCLVEADAPVQLNADAVATLLASHK